MSILHLVLVLHIYLFLSPVLLYPYLTLEIPVTIC